YNVASQVTGLTFGSGDSDAFSFAPLTNRMATYAYNIGSSPTKTMTGSLTWNANGTLQQLAIVDPWNSGGNQTCLYGFDDLTRIVGANCRHCLESNIFVRRFWQRDEIRQPVVSAGIF